MTFLEILRSKETNLPIASTKGINFRKVLKTSIENFGELIESSSQLSEAINGIDFKAEIFKKRNRILRQGILDTVDAYYKGRPHLAYGTLKRAIDDSYVKQYLDKQCVIERGTSLFRIRVANGNFPLKSTELFHIPFEKRGIVRTQRYSIPGLPSLYLSNCIYVAWEELLRPGFESIQAIRLTNTKAIKLLDLTTDIYTKNSHLKNNNEYGWQLLYKVMTWPLAAACSFKVANIDDTFKPEYIIPQILLQWTNMDTIDGIKYSSTHIDNKYTNGLFYNVVIPVKVSNEETGLCPKLLKLFKATKSVPMQLRQFATTADRFYEQESIQVHVNRDIESIELITGVKQPYASTQFGVLEHSLNHLKVEPIK